MKQDKSEQAVSPSIPAGTTTPDQSLIVSPKNKRKSSASYWKQKLEGNKGEGKDRTCQRSCKKEEKWCHWGIYQVQGWI